MKAHIGPSGKLWCLWQTIKIMQHMHGNIPYMLDCWANPVVHLLQLTSSMVEELRGCELEREEAKFNLTWLFKIILLCILLFGLNSFLINVRRRRRRRLRIEKIFN